MYSFVPKKNVILLIMKYEVWKCNNVMLSRESSKSLYPLCIYFITQLRDNKWIENHSVDSQEIVML